MKIAIPVWGNRISPVFETAEHLLLVDLDDGVELKREIRKLDAGLPVQRVKLLEDTGVQLLACGAITREVETSFDSNKIKIIPFLCGNVEQLIAALSKGDNIRAMFGMPGRHDI